LETSNFGRHNRRVEFVQRAGLILFDCKRIFAGVVNAIWGRKQLIFFWAGAQRVWTLAESIGWLFSLGWSSA